MDLSLIIRKTAQSVLDYLQSFQPRQDTYTLKGDGTVGTAARESRPAAPVPPPVAVLSNPEAFKDLNIGFVMDQVFMAVPRHYEKGEVRDREYIEQIFHHPVIDVAEIVARQEAITELQTDAALWDQVLAVKSCLDACLYDERFSRSVPGLKSLQDVNNIVELVAAIRRMGMPAARRLKRVKDLGCRFDADLRFREAEKFVRELYIPYGLGDVMDGNTDFLHSISGVGTRREFYSGNRILLEVTQRMFSEEPFKHFINDEAVAIDLLTTMQAKLGIWHKEIFGFNLTGYDLEQWGKKERKRYSDLLEYWLSLVNEAVYARVPNLEIGDMAHELGFYLGASALQRKWVKAGYPVSNPILLDKKIRNARIHGSFNTSLMAKLTPDRVVSNDILFDRDHNLFVITGPNNGGKTTYIRQVGQMYWLAHIGMGLPAESAQMSALDAVFTSFNTEDNTAEGTGLYLTELKRIAQFARPAPGQPRLTPYSIIFFDEFANGTDHEESVKRTRTVLEYLSQKGVTAFFTTHKHEIADIVEGGGLPGAVNLAAEAKRSGDAVETSYRIVRDAQERSYGYVQAEAMGITPDALRAQLMREVAEGWYPLEDTRLNKDTPVYASKGEPD